MSSEAAGRRWALSPSLCREDDSCLTLARPRVAMQLFFFKLKKKMALAAELVRPRLKFSSREMPAHFWCRGWCRWWECFSRKETSFDSGFVAFFNASKTVLGWIIAVQNAGLRKKHHIWRTRAPSLRLFIHHRILQLHFNYSRHKKNNIKKTSTSMRTRLFSFSPFFSS